MAYWHTAAPNSGEAFGWVGRLADTMAPEGAPNYIVNIDETQSLAVNSACIRRSSSTTPSASCARAMRRSARCSTRSMQAAHSENAAQQFLLRCGAQRPRRLAQVREAWANYSSPVDYGIVPLGLNKIASLIAANMPTRLYYTSYPHNAFDTHVHQGDVHARLLTYVADAVAASCATWSGSGAPTMSRC